MLCSSLLVRVYLISLSQQLGKDQFRAQLGVEVTILSKQQLLETRVGPIKCD